MVCNTKQASSLFVPCMVPKSRLILVFNKVVRNKKIENFGH